LTGEFLGFGVFAVENQPAHLRQRGKRVGVVRIIRAAGPERVFVKLEMFASDAAKNHRTQTAIANGQRLGPFLGGPAIPQRQRTGRWPASPVKVMAELDAILVGPGGFCAGQFAASISRMDRAE